MFIKYKKVTYLVLALELYKIAYRFNNRAIIKEIINRVLKFKVLLTIYINLKLLYNYIIKLSIT